MAKTKVKVQMVGQNGNAFAIMGRWQAAARKGGWTPAEIKEVIDNATSGDYNYLLATIMEWVKFLEDEETECCDGCGAEAAPEDMCKECEHCLDNCCTCWSGDEEEE